MKRRILLTILLIFTILLAPTILLVGQKTYADSTQGGWSLSTKPFLPASYFEYYNLSEPVDICSDDGFYYIAQPNKIVKFDKSTSTYSEIQTTEMENMSITKIECYNGYLFFLDASNIYCITPQGQVQSTQVHASTHFLIQNGTLYANTSSTIEIYSIDLEGFTFTKIMTITTANESFSFGVENNKLYYFTTNNLYIKDVTLNPEDRTPIKLDASVTYSKFYGGTLYFINSNGLHSYVPNSETPLLIGEISGALGMCFENDKVLMCFKDLNVIKEYNLTNKSFTNKMVTTTSNELNRLSANVIDVAYDTDYVYVLQNDNVVKFSKLTNTYSKLDITFSFTPKLISVSKDYVLLSNGSTLSLYKQGKTKDNVTSVTKIEFDYPDSNNNITCISSYNDNFFILQNDTKNNTLQAVVRELNPESASIVTENLRERDYTILGRGDTMTINAFGEMFVLINSSKIVRYDMINASKKEIACEISGIKKLQADFETLYALTENKIINLLDNTTYEITKKSHYGSEMPVSMSLSIEDSCVYVLYKGFILTTQDLPVKTPNNFKMPQNFNLTVREDVEITKVKQGAKMYVVEIGDGEYFKYVSSVEATTDEYYVLVEKLSDEFSLIVYEFSSVQYENKTLIVRNVDVAFEPATPVEPTSTKGYYVTQAGLYSLPTLNQLYKISTIPSYSSVEILKVVTINDTDYFKVQISDKTGYIASNFIVEEILSVTPSETFTTGFVSIAEVFNATGEKIGEITNQQVIIYGKEDGKYKIKYNDGFGYINESALEKTKDNSMRNSIVIILVGTIFCITALYLLVRLNRKKVNSI